MVRRKKIMRERERERKVTTYNNSHICLLPAIWWWKLKVLLNKNYIWILHLL